MPVSFEFLRGMLGLIGLGCAYMAGRSLAAVYREEKPVPALRMDYPSGALPDGDCVPPPGRRDRDGVVGTRGRSLRCGYMHTLHRKPPEDLTDEIFPHES